MLVWTKLYLKSSKIITDVTLLTISRLEICLTLLFEATLLVLNVYETELVLKHCIITDIILLHIYTLIFKLIFFRNRSYEANIIN